MRWSSHGGAHAVLISQQLSSTSFFASLAWTLGFSLLLAAGFCFLRPRTNAVYAPRAKHADTKHAPPRLDTGYFSWIQPIKAVKEQDLVEKIGMDAVVFLRFLRMLRNILLAITLLGLTVILPVNRIQTTQGLDAGGITEFIRFTPQFSNGPIFWAYTICAYIFDGIICFFIWWNYRKVVQLRRQYLQSPEYLSSLHSRTLMVSNGASSMPSAQLLTYVSSSGTFPPLEEQTRAS